jgi:serine/threonine-protein kinase HSL1 (negative regulator of Swe1 kinase)
MGLPPNSCRTPLMDVSAQGNKILVLQTFSPKTLAPTKENIKPTENIFSLSNSTQTTTTQFKTINLVPPSLVNYDPTRLSANLAMASQADTARVGPWLLDHAVGSGGSCSVRFATHVQTGEFAVAKIITKEQAEKIRARSLTNLFSRVENEESPMGVQWNMPLSLEREVAIMRLLNHTNIVRLYDVWESDDAV